MGLAGKIASPLISLGVIAWDNVIAVANLVTPKLKADNVVPEGAPGHHGVWPEFIPPQEGDSRSACPMLNAMANHGILPHDGKNIPFKTLNQKVRQTFNFAPSFCFFVPKFAADFLERSYWKDTFDLEDLSLHASNAIEHDASLTRQDMALEPDQGKPDQELVDALLAEATGKKNTTTDGGEDGEGERLLTIEDLSRALSKRRAECRRSNEEYSESFFHNTFGSANSSTMLTIFGGRIDDLTPMLKEERFSDHWQPRIVDKFGLTMAKFNFTVFPVERGVDVKPFEKKEG
ncbi:uncharacterized protein RCC_04393 [Ramularia collo-cygni]|uniref:Heme haloperoxidase family profile domain-containing protein n=1 Tax=Ramularia collo-cygni TaxID=112498 RepID=A0A2D3VAI6_9PEZI|nr:uncharacterized protein RCC_04393 [Ramularia collo-cygni]CZT18549.1 uncharacterized protein RCC_04393 [Ramularia collo-cygni]